jgi:hypothetical protein
MAETLKTLPLPDDPTLATWASALNGVDATRMTYTPLAELATATDKARRDAPSIAVCEL